MRGMAKLAVALSAAPPLVVFAWCVRWLLQRRWRAAMLLIAATLVISAIVAGVALVGEQSWQPLAAEEHYSLDGWYWVWFLGAYAMTCGAVVFLPLATAIVWLWKKWQARSTRLQTA
jgi:hypothetical protein